MERGGRPRHNYWEEGGFKSIRQNGKLVASCLECKQIINNTAEQRLKSHRKKCIWESEIYNSYTVDDSVIQHSSKKRKERSGSYNANNNSSTGVTDKIATPSTIKPKKTTPKMNSFVDKISECELSKLDEALSYLFFSKSLPFELVEDIYFKKFCKTLRPAYKLPNQIELSTRLLDDAHNKLTQSQVKINDNERVLLFCRNISNSTSLEIVAIIKCDSNTLFVKSWNLSDEDDFSYNYWDMVEEARILILKKYNMSIYSVISFTGNLKISNTLDDSAIMAPASESTVKWHLTCHLQTVDTLIKSIHDDVLEIKINRLLDKFKGTNIKNEIIKKSGEKLLNLEEDVEHSYYSKLSVSLKILPIIRQIVGEGLGKFDQDLLIIIFDELFESELKESVVILEFLSKFKENSEEKCLSIADSIEKWFKFKACITNEEYKKIVDYQLQKKITPQTLTANFLHPSYKGNAFMKIKKYSDMVYEFLIDELDCEGLEELDSYKNSQGLFAKLFVKTECPKTFWSIALEKYSKISTLAQFLIKIPACTFRLNQCVLDKNLPNDLAVKLTNVFYSLKFMNMN